MVSEGRPSSPELDQLIPTHLIQHLKQGGLGFAGLRCFYYNRNELDKQSQPFKKHIKFNRTELLYF